MLVWCNRDGFTAFTPHLNPLLSRGEETPPAPLAGRRNHLPPLREETKVEVEVKKDS